MTHQIILLPGLLCDDAVWADQRGALGALGECFVPNYGMRDSLGAMAERVLESVSAERLLVAGHSMGGRVALELFRRAPERVAGLALLDTGYTSRAAGEAGESERTQRLRLLELARAKGMRAMGDEWAPGMVNVDRHDSAVYEAVLEMIERSTPDKFAAQIRALLDRPDATALLRDIACPTMIVCGRDDRWSPPAHHEAMHAQIRGSRLRVIERSGHMCTMERPDDVTDVLVEWAQWVAGAETAR